MIALLRRYASHLAIVLFVVLLLPPVQHVLTASMTAQMLLQIPLLILVGWLLRGAPPQRFVSAISAWNYNGITGLILATLTTAVWMLPRSLDAAATEPLMATLKFLSVPLLIGLPLGISWPRMGFVLRGVFIAELISMFFRLGWLYMITPTRLCTNYLVGDQQRSGQYMMLIGGAIFAWLAIKLLWGRFDSLSDDQHKST